MTARDEAADYRRAYLAEYEAYKANCLGERAAAVADVLRSLGCDPDKPVVVKESAQGEPLPERAVEEAPKRRGRPHKTVAEPESEPEPSDG